MDGGSDKKVRGRVEGRGEMIERWQWGEVGWSRCDMSSVWTVVCDGVVRNGVRMGEALPK